ncbi:MAG: rRNA maturation RNase YbeY [Bythopirellula sp.]|nr:rRNA maturation RNase YbeY [Bythopirellula sp.]
MNENCPPDSFPPATPAMDGDSDPAMQAYRILVANEQATLAIDEARLIAAARSILADSEYPAGVVSIAVVDDPTIHALNVQYLQHDYPTDVLSFVLEEAQQCVEGELVVSADTAVREASEAGWSPLDELLLYVIHGTLHLIGYDDHEPSDQVEMYRAEAYYLQKLGVQIAADQTRWLAGVGKESQS